MPENTGPIGKLTTIQDPIADFRKRVKKGKGLKEGKGMDLADQ